ncbi:4064_t:CDS:2 [Acaulospora morrowiae]|uniref:4064_t:CDS:1 n=1 Tax=Acaulospora morrowiae TaxID=94023 RepID=A0A9N9F485_9GLOM|nr:4064_t:CDS:2 [Acaulospora morrowiae]
MVHNTLAVNCAPTEEKELKRISSLEQRVAELENTLLRTAAAALEKRVAELEASLRESNEECDKLRKTIVDMESACKKVIPRTKEEDTFEVNDFTSEGDEKDSEKDSEKDIFESSEEQDNNSPEISDAPSVSFDDKEAEVIYGRVLKLIENMKSDCTKAIHLKIHTSMLGRSRAPSVSGIFTPSRPATPSSGHQVSSNISNSPTRIPPSRISSLPSPNGSHVSSRPGTPSGVHSISTLNSTGSSSSSTVISHNLRRKSSSISRPRTPNWLPNCSTPSGAQSPPSCNGIGIQSNLHSSIIPSGIPSNLPSKSTNIPMHIPSMRHFSKSHDSWTAILDSLPLNVN